MSLWAKSFSFNGTPCEAFGMMMYNIGSGEESFNLPGVGEVSTETVGGRWRSFCYGLKYPEQLKLTITFGPNEDRLDNGQFIDRAEVDNIVSWLIGHREWKWLEIEQDDLRHIRFRCLATELEQIDYGTVCWGFRVTFTCDSPFGYMHPQIQTFDVYGDGAIVIANESSVNGFYYPTTIIEGLNGDLSITNSMDKGRKFELTDVPASAGRITVDHERRIITSTGGTNMYKLCNFQFLRLVRGYNKIYIRGSCRLTFICEYPVNVGG